MARQAGASEENIIPVSEEMIQAGLKVLSESGQLEYQPPAQSFLVAEIYKAMVSGALLDQ